MKIRFPEIGQADLAYAVECLEDCKHAQALEFGFSHPYFAPGGGYGAQWWQLDSSLALVGYKWVDRRFAEEALLNFVESQKEDGRICLWGADRLPESVAGDNRVMQTEGVSSLPKIFDAAFHILQGSSDRELAEKVYAMLTRYIDWWYRDRFDAGTGLFSSVFEETFIPYLGCAGEYAAVDTNVEVYVGLSCTARLAERLGKPEDARALRERAERLKASINVHLWDPMQGAYYPCDLRTRRPTGCLMASALFPLRMGIAPGPRRVQLVRLLLDDAHFNWNTIPLTSVSKKDPAFCTTTGDYQGNASWSGNVWTLINETVVRGLLDCGEKDLAAEFALKTVRAFNHNCSEFINPFDGSGQGVLKYAWTASQYLELLIEVIFGVRFDAEKAELSVAPNLTPSLAEESISIEGLQLTEDVCADVFIDRGKIRCVLPPNSKIRVRTDN